MAHEEQDEFGDNETARAASKSAREAKPTPQPPKRRRETFPYDELPDDEDEETDVP